ncbi:integrase [Helicobacter enhydrae]|uniref:Integrase n=1 Tax=Helicobacter enhydrae TaxID=222136 RepID=A0A1B1U460_9HELI|nr:integrase [Helicobacter enhydrae]
MTTDKILSKKDFKILALSSFGGMLEFYDFIIFIFFTRFISQLFFSSELDIFWQTFNTYAIFASGYLARPVGGIVMAHFGDKFGRKKMFMLGLFLMVIPTFVLSLIPTYQQIGIFAPLLLIGIRFMQGIAIGGEVPGAWIFVKEHAPPKQIGLYLSVLTASIVGGILLGNIIALITHYLFTQDELMAWAWRIPFFVGGIFGIIAIFLRRFLEETPIFVQMRQEGRLQKFPLQTMLYSSKKPIVFSMLISLVLTGCILIFILLMPNFIQEILNLDFISRSYWQMIGIFILMFGCVIAGKSADSWGIPKACRSFAIGLGICSVVFFVGLYGLMIPNNWIMFAYCLVCFFCGIMIFSPLIMTLLFKPQFAFSGLSFSYNIIYAIAGGITPPLVFTLHNYAIASGTLHWFGVFGLCLYILTLVSIALFVSKSFIRSDHP